MSFDWEEFLILAHELVGKSTRSAHEDAKMRSAISRAYYAAFNRAKSYLIDKDYDRSIPTDGRAHEEVKNKFLNHDDERRQRIGTNLERILKDRKRADYNNTFQNLPVQVSLVLKQARQVIELLDKLS
jgi:uncharacterized protein (UPF0332 family)